MSKEKGSRSPSPWNRTPWTRLRTTRSRRWMKATAVLALTLGLFHLFSSVGTHRKALREKFTPTIFHRLTPQNHTKLSNTSWKWGDQSRHDVNSGPYSREDTWANRLHWKKLGSGAEGDTFVYNGTVIKAYRTGQAPFRNCVPDASPELRWPTEISASLLLGGAADAESMEKDINFLPVIDYFLSPASNTEAPTWHFLTPFLPSGSLPRLVHHLKTSRHAYTPRELDKIFRPSLEQLLDTLDQMHEQFDLCHDDIKLDNIFIASPHALEEAGDDLDETKHWILADLGNVREPSHPYHSSILWSVLNRNLPDCQVNDVLRLLKIYMSFLGHSVNDVTTFSKQFVEGREPWSRLFWKTWHDIQLREKVSALKVKETSMQLDPVSLSLPNSVNVGHRPFSQGSTLYRLLLGPEGALTQEVKDFLKVSTPDLVSRLRGLTSWFGVPVGACAV